MSTNDEQKAAGSHGRSYSAHSESDTSSSELDAMGASLPSRAVRGTMGGRGILRPASFTDDGDGSKKKAVTIDAASSVGHDRSSSVASSVGQSGVMHGGLSTISNSNASSRRASVVSNAQSELGTFLTMGIDLKGDMPTPPPPQVRRASVMMMRAPTDMTRQSVTTAVYTSNDPNRLAKIENAANFVIDDSLLSNMSSMSFEPPPIFGNHELAQVIDMVLAKVAGESNTRASAEDVVAIFHGSFGADVPDHFPKDEEGRKYHSAIVALQIKLKTSNAILNEMGKRMEKLQRWVNEVSSRAAAFEQERTHHVAVVEALRNQIKGLEMRAETAEAAINNFDRIHIDNLRKGYMQKSFSDGEAEGSGESEEEGEQQHSSYYPISKGHIGKGAYGAKKSRSRRKEHHRRKTAETDLIDYDPFEVPLDGKVEADNDAPKEITREVIVQTARIMGVKKRFDPPTALGVGLKAMADREEHMGANPMAQRFLLKSPYQTLANSYRSNKVPRLLHAAIDHKNHLAAVLSAQTQELLATKTPDTYIKVLHTQLNGTIKALHDCIDALSEEQRISEHWRFKWVRAQARINAESDVRKKEELKAISNASSKSYSGAFANSAFSSTSVQNSYGNRPTTVDTFAIFSKGRGQEFGPKRQRSKSAEPVFFSSSGESYLNANEATNNGGPNKSSRQLKSASRPLYQQESSLLSSPLTSIAMPAPVPKWRARNASSTSNAANGRAVTAPEHKARKEHIIVPAAKTDFVDALGNPISARPGENAPPPTPIPPNRDNLRASSGRGSHSVEFALPSSSNIAERDGIPSWRLNKGSVSSARYRSIVPRIASLGPFLQTSSDTPQDVLRALYSSSAGSQKWGGSTSIYARPRGDVGVEEALRPFTQPGSERKAMSIRSARRMLSAGSKVQNKQAQIDV